MSAPAQGWPAPGAGYGPRWPAGLALLLALAVGFGPAFGKPREPAWDYEATVGYGEAARADVMIQMQRGTLSVSAESTSLVQMRARRPRGTADPVVRYVETPAGRGSLTVSIPGMDEDVELDRNAWEIDFGTDVPMTLTMEFERVDAELDLGLSTFRSIQMVAGSGDVGVDLTRRRGTLSVWVISGNGTLRLALPADPGAVVRVTDPKKVAYTESEFAPKGGSLISTGTPGEVQPIQVHATGYTGAIELDLR